MEQRRSRLIREVRRGWDAFIRLSNRKDRAVVVKDVAAQVTLNRELATTGLEVELAKLDRQCDRVKTPKEGTDRT